MIYLCFVVRGIFIIYPWCVLFQSKRVTKKVFLANKQLLKFRMACLNVLKQEIKAIESCFPKTHERYVAIEAV